MQKMLTKDIMKEHEAQHDEQEHLSSPTNGPLANKGSVLSHYDSAQTLSMAQDSTLTPGDSTLAFPSQDERSDHLERSQERLDTQKHKYKYKGSAPPTGPSSTAELISALPSSSQASASASTSRAAPTWLLLLHRHWNHLVPLWIALSLLCILVLLVAVPVETLQPAPSDRPFVSNSKGLEHVMQDGCAGAHHSAETDADRVVESIVDLEGTTTTTTLPSEVLCWSTISATNKSTSASAIRITVPKHTTREQHPRPAQAQPPNSAQQQLHHPFQVPRVHLGLLLLTLTLFVLPLPGYILVGGCCWVELHVQSGKGKGKEREKTSMRKRGSRRVSGGGRIE